MNILLVAVAPAAAILILCLVVWLVVHLVRGPAAPAQADAARAAHRHASAVTGLAWVALAVVLVSGVTVVSRLPLNLQQGLLLGLVPAAAGVALAAVQAVGELTWPRPTGTVRRAPLVRRTAGDVAPRRMRLALWAWSGGLVALLLVCGVLAEPDGRSVGRTYADGLGASASGPFPGWFYGLPLIVATVVVLLASEGTLRLVARRPAVSDTAAEWDLGLRRLSAHRLLRGAQLVLGMTAAGVLFFAGAATRSVGSGTMIDGDPMDSLGHVVLGTAMMLGALAAAATAVAIATIPAAPPRHAPGGPVPAPAPEGLGR